MSQSPVTRRQLLGGVGALIAGAAMARGRQGSKPGQACVSPASGIEPPRRLAPRDELVLMREFEENAKFALSSAVFSTIAGGDHCAFDRITLRPRLLIPTLDMDLSVELFGDRLFAPILVGPIPEQMRYHHEGEIATARGASAAKAVMVVSSGSSAPIEQVAAQARAPLWFQVAIEPGAASQIQRAVKAGCKAICVSVGAAPAIDWAAIDQLRNGLSRPLLVTGIMTPAEAESAIRHGAQGIIVSRHGRPHPEAPIMVLPSIVDAVGGKVPVLVQGGFELGADIFKALAFGARGVLIGRPAMWGLSAYGSGGVQSVLRMLQCDLGRTMAMSGTPNLASIDRSRLKLHAA